MNAQGAQAAADMNDVKSPETYVGYTRAENFASPGGAVDDKRHVYAIAPQLQLNQWALAGDWTIGGERAVLERRRTAASPIASTRAICISCSGLRRTASRCASA